MQASSRLLQMFTATMRSILFSSLLCCFSRLYLLLNCYTVRSGYPSVLYHYCTRRVGFPVTMHNTALPPKLFHLFFSLFFNLYRLLYTLCTPSRTFFFFSPATFWRESEIVHFYNEERGKSIEGIESCEESAFNTFLISFSRGNNRIAHCKCIHDTV